MRAEDFEDGKRSLGFRLYGRSVPLAGMTGEKGAWISAEHVARTPA